MSSDLRPRHITVVLSAYNAASTLERAIRSLLDQTYRDFDLYVVDDASSDETAAAAEPFLSLDSRVHLLRLRSNIGLHAVRNLILTQVPLAEFFAHQDADDYSLPERFARQVSFLSERPSVGGCGTGVDEFYAHGVQPHIPAQQEAQLDPVDGYLHRPHVYEQWLPRGCCCRSDVSDMTKLTMAANGAMMFRTAALRELGGFDGRTRVSGDTEMFWRLQFFYDLANLPEILYARWFHPESLTSSPTVGVGTAGRRAYVMAAAERLQTCCGLHASGDWTALRRLTTHDFYYPPVEVDEITAPPSIEDQRGRPKA